MRWPFRKRKREMIAEDKDLQENVGDIQGELPPEERVLSSDRGEAGEVFPEIGVEDIKREREKVDLDNQESRLAYITYLCDTINSAKLECEKVKFEYGLVTSHLKDIQLIDQALPEEKEVLLDIADGIYELTKERNRLQKQKYQITDSQKNVLKEKEGAIERDMKTLREEESFLLKVKSDLGQLNAEKSTLLHDRKEIAAKQRILKKLSKAMISILVGLMILLFSVGEVYRRDIVVPFIGLVAFGFLISSYIMYEVYKNRRDIIITDKKCQRAILLINRIKIKYVNSVRLIRYMCDEYKVRNGIELEFVYGQYQKMKAELEKQQLSTKLLGDYHRILLNELEKIGVKDRELWFFQTEALINPKEMVEVRHRLNTRRQKIRDRIDYNSDGMEFCIQELEKIIEKNLTYKEEVEDILRKF